ncbi:MAG: biopolymer transporter ExbD [Syntrophorhabdaceae bacterium]|nr:biopolymer transporter ExbD [Syntrophorhabdaceae bacterium]
MDEKEFNYINMIPFIDVMLVLLVIVLMTGTFVATGIIPVDLPKTSGAQENAMKTGVIEIDRSGVVYYQARRVELAGLKDALGGTSRDTPFLIRADRDIHLQRFVEVLETVKSMGFRKVSLQTEEEN